MEEISDMIKMKTLAFMTILMLALTGCGKEEQEPYTGVRWEFTYCGYIDT